MRSVGSVRRYCLLKAQALERQLQPSLAGAYRAKQDAVPGTTLPAGFPHAAALAAGRYTTREDLTGADVRELVTNSTLSTRDATTVLKALAAL